MRFMVTSTRWMNCSSDVVMALCARGRRRHHKVVARGINPLIDGAVVHGRAVSQILGNEVGERGLHAGPAIGDDRLVRVARRPVGIVVAVGPDGSRSGSARSESAFSNTGSVSRQCVRPWEPLRNSRCLRIPPPAASIRSTNRCAACSSGRAQVVHLCRADQDLGLNMGSEVGEAQGELLPSTVFRDSAIHFSWPPSSSERLSPCPR